MCSTAMLLSTFQKKNRTLGFFVSHVSSGTMHSFCEHITAKALKLVRRYVCTAKTKGSLLIQLGVSQLQASSLPKNVHTGRSITLFAQHNTFMVPIITGKKIRTAKPKGLH